VNARDKPGHGGGDVGTMTTTTEPTMRPEADSPKPSPSWRDALAVYLKPRVLIVLFLGFSAGLPLALSGLTLR